MTKSFLHRAAMVLGLAALAVAALPALAFAQTDPADEVGTAIQGATTSGLSVVSDNMPLVFGIAVAFVAWRIGKRVLARI